MMRVERSEMRSTIISSMISSTEFAEDLTAPVQGEQPSVRNRQTMERGVSPGSTRACPSTGINCSPRTTTSRSRAK